MEDNATLEAKIYLAEKISEEVHPSFGVELGLSEYTGGMKDSGSWNVFKLLKQPLNMLQKIYFNHAQQVTEAKEFIHNNANRTETFEEKSARLLNEIRLKLDFGQDAAEDEEKIRKLLEKKSADAKLMLDTFNTSIDLVKSMYPKPQ